MKRNVILGLSAVVFAIGSAFTSISDDQINNVWVRLQLVPNGPFVCSQTNKSCDELGTQVCKVTVQLQSGATKAVNAHPDNQCAATIGSSQTPVPGTWVRTPSLPVDAID